MQKDNDYQPYDMEQVRHIAWQLCKAVKCMLSERCHLLFSAFMLPFVVIFVQYIGQCSCFGNGIMCTIVRDFVQFVAYNHVLVGSC